jgi:hypothetical protein
VSLATTASQVSYVGNGVTRTFQTTFAYLDSSHLLVEVKASGGVFVAQVEGVDYTVSLDGAPEPGGTVLFTSAPADASTVRITRNTPQTQPVSFVSQGEFLPEVHELAHDNREMQIQELDRRVDALEAGTTTSTYTAARLTKVFTMADPIEDTFPLTVAAGAAIETCVIGRVECLDQPGEVRDEPAALQWHPSGNNVILDRISGLTPGLAYRIKLEVRT